MTAPGRDCGCGDHTAHDAASCGCCAGLELSTPVAIENSPGQPTLAWRVGTHARFKRSMLTLLGRDPVLRGVTTRDDDDPTIALVDAWSAALDVLTFYQERIANEHYLRTATERRSILELARAIGYELAPGVSASTLLAFGLETAPGAPVAAEVPAGTKVQSIPGQDEKPQLYETSVALAARGAWNAMAVRWRDSRVPATRAAAVHLAGVSTGLQPGDALLIVDRDWRETDADSRWDFRRVGALETHNDPLDPANGYTRVVLDRPLAGVSSTRAMRVFGMRQRAGLFGGSAPDFALMPASVREEILNAEVTFELDLPGRRSSGGRREVEVRDIRQLGLRPEWPDFTIGYSDSPPSGFDTLHLDNAYKSAVQGGWLLLTAADVADRVYRIAAVAESGLARFALSGKSTRVELTGDLQALATDYWRKLRKATVFLQTEEFEVAERPIDEPLRAGATYVDLEGELLGDDVLSAGRAIVVAQYPDAARPATLAEPATVVSVTRIQGEGERPRTRLTLAQALTGTYARRTTVVHGNVTEATHGEATLRQLPNGLFVTEVLGSGNGSIPFQQFVLKQKPLTHVSAPNARGRATTLRVRVDGVLWREASTLYDVGPEERVYVVRQADDGQVTVQFGNGVTGARLPTGVENVTAVYRVGTGLEGQVDAGQLTLLMSRPLGVRDVRNPLAAAGAEDAERLDDARVNAPLTVLTLDRVVSLLDYEDFARAFAGIGKAMVTLLWTGERQTVHITVGLADGSAPTDTSRTLADLRAAIDGARHALRPVLAQGYRARPFRVTAKVAVDAEHDAAIVVARVRDALLSRFAFANRHFAQHVTESEVVAAMQGVRGVAFVDLDALAFVGGSAAVEGRLAARPARVEGSTIEPAELLTLAATDIQLTARAP